MKKLLLILSVAFIVFKTITDISPVPDELLPAGQVYKKLSIRDRLGAPLVISYQDDLNTHNYISISSIPEFLKNAFLFLEDKRFFDHEGVDWRARLSAVYQNIKNLKVVRGASTITEQTVRILHPRPRTVWARWIEGFEASKFEQKFQKEEIFEFYLNEVPYAGKKRGVVQAAYTYFDRDLDTLNKLEMLCLAYLVRAPSRFDPLKNKLPLQARLKKIAQEMKQKNLISEYDLRDIENTELKISPFEFKPDMSHFVKFVEAGRSEMPASAVSNGKLISTIDSEIQSKVRILLEHRIKELSEKNVQDGAVLVVDHRENQILAWVNAGSFSSAADSSQIDAITALRQPGSTLKPFLYALALENGWNAATIINDSPLIHAVGNGMHNYRNYSRIHYGDIRLREALANSLNIPAIHTITFTGVGEFHKLLFKLGFKSLSQPSTFYGEGLALGNGEVSLLDLVTAYTVLAKGGVKEKLSFIRNDKSAASDRVISKETSILISDILSDPIARRHEFGRFGVLDFPMQTAVKTGTSTDFHDVWAVGYSHDFTVGIWLGNLNRQAMHDVSGASGPGLLLRSIFSELYKHKEPSPLYRKSDLQKQVVCAISGKLPGETCPRVDEVFNPQHLPEELCALDHASLKKSQDSIEYPSVMFPTPGLQIAMDPRVPDENEAIRFRLKDANNAEKIEWIIDGKAGEENLWLLAKGSHSVYARVFAPQQSEVFNTDVVNFYVK